MLKYFILVFFSTAAFSFDKKIVELFVPSFLDRSVSCDKFKDQVKSLLGDVSLMQIEDFSNKFINDKVLNKYFPLSFSSEGSLDNRSYPIFSKKTIDVDAGFLEFSLSKKFGVFACQFPSCLNRMRLFSVGSNNYQVKNLFV